MSRSKKYLIYIVDDEQFNLILISGKLKKNINCKTRLFTNVSECSLAIDEKRPDLVLCDLRLGAPDENGVRLLDFLHEREVQVPVIMYSSAANFDLELELIGKGASDFVPRNKNFPMTLIDSVKNQIDLTKENVREKKLGFAYILTLLCLIIALYAGEKSAILSLDIFDVILIWALVLVLFIMLTMTEFRKFI